MSIGVKSYLRRSVDLWPGSANWTESLSAAPEYDTQDQCARERHLQDFLDLLSSEKSKERRTGEERRASQDRLLTGFDVFAESALGFDKDQVEALRLEDMARISGQFASAAKRFDPCVSAEDVFQAMRNAWTMCYLQLLMGMPARLTPAIFAYSMLYPYSDNYLDDPDVNESDKARFNWRMRARLMGKHVTPTDSRERVIYRLISKIEDQFPRTDHQQVFQSLLAIHLAQERSTRLLGPGATTDPSEILRRSFEKGGCSVLADGYLVAGQLTRAQAEFLFRLGTVLQLVDDLQDVGEDVEGGLMTVFSGLAAKALSRGGSSRSHAPRPICLDEVTTKLFGYAAEVSKGIVCFDSPDSVHLREVTKLGIMLLLTLTAGSLEELHSRSYVEALEAHSPFRFGFLRQCRDKYAKQGLTRPSMVEVYAQLTSTDIPAPFEIESVSA